MADERQRKLTAIAYYKKLVANEKKIGKYVNINVKRDMIASHLHSKGLFRTYEAARKWVTDWIFSTGKI